MNKHIVIVGIVAALLVLAGCSLSATSNSLTTDRAQLALDQWADGNGTLLVQGIQELPGQNAAKVDFNVEHYEWQEQYIGTKRYQGHGVAIFSHYTDGRWVLTNVSFTNDLLAKWTANITVE